MHKSLLIQTVYSSQQRLVFFPSSQVVNKFINRIKSSEMDEDFADIYFEDEKFTTKYKNVKSIVHPANKLRGAEDSPLFDIEVIFENGFSINIPASGRKRADYSFKKLKNLQNVDPTDSYIQIKQDLKFLATIRWESRIAEIYCTEKEEV